jgi:hypothetical protein
MACSVEDLALLLALPVLAILCYFSAGCQHFFAAQICPLAIFFFSLSSLLATMLHALLLGSDLFGWGKRFVRQAGLLAGSYFVDYTSRFLGVYLGLFHMRLVRWFLLSIRVSQIRLWGLGHSFRHCNEIKRHKTVHEVLSFFAVPYICAQGLGQPQQQAGRIPKGILATMFNPIR